MKNQAFEITSADDLIRVFPELERRGRPYKAVDAALSRMEGVCVYKWDVDLEAGEHTYFGKANRPFAFKFTYNGKQLAFGRIRIEKKVYADGFDRKKPGVDFFEVLREGQNGEQVVRTFSHTVQNWARIGRVIGKFLGKDWFEVTNTKRCKKCGGTGKIDHYRHVHQGDCFRCGGSGVDPKQ